MDIHDICAGVAERVGIVGPRGPVLTAEIRDLAERAMVADELPRRPNAVAAAIARHLDHIP